MAPAKASSMHGWKTGRPIRLGFLPLNDCAPLVMAHELGLYEQYGLEVELRRETSWANVRDKIIYGELDAAHAPGGLLFATNLGLGSDQCACVSGLVLNLQGNAITISRDLWEWGVRDAGTLREAIRSTWGRKTLTFGVVFQYSSHHFLLRQWLRSAGINPDTDVRIVVVPPAQMFPNLKLGYLDGYCVGEPWTSVAVQAQAGVCVATSVELAPLHPEKVLMTSLAFAEEHADTHERLIAALLDACAFCDQTENRRHLSECLAQPRYVNAPAECLKAALVGPFDLGSSRIQSLLDLSIFHRHQANDPTDEKASWIMDGLYDLLQSGALKASHTRIPILKNAFRRDLFHRATQLVRQQATLINSETKHETDPILPPDALTA